MHKCLKCGRLVSDILEIQEGCTCGSKVFVFTRLEDSKEQHSPEVKKREAHVSFLPRISRQISSFGKALAKKDSDEAPKAPGIATPIQPISSSQGAPAAEAQSQKGAPAINGAGDAAAKSQIKIEPPAAQSKAEPENFPLPAPAVQTTLDVHAKPAPEAGGGAQGASPAAAAKPAQAVEISDAQAIASESPPPSSTQAKASQPAAVASSIISEEPQDGPGEDYQEVWLAKGGIITALESGASAPQSAGIENVRQLSRGVYEVDLKALRDGPLVVRDSEGVYYVRLPFSQPEIKKGNTKTN